MTEVYPNALLTERSLNQQESLDRIVNSLEGELKHLSERIEDAHNNIDKLIERIDDLASKVKWNDIDMKTRVEKIEKGKAERIT